MALGCGESKPARGGLKECLGRLKPELVGHAPEVGGPKPGLGRLDLDDLQSKSERRRVDPAQTQSAEDGARPNRSGVESDAPEFESAEDGVRLKNALVRLKPCGAD
jgi:hypothetical protein